MRVKQNQSDENINMSPEVILLVYSLQNIISGFCPRPMAFSGFRLLYLLTALGTVDIYCSRGPVNHIECVI